MKRCSNCKEEKKLDQFNKWTKAKDGLHNRCRDCQREYQRELYKNSPKRRAQIRAVDDKRKQELRLWWLDYKRNTSCTDCGLSDSRVIQFDHLPGYVKQFTISDGIRKNLSKDRILAELKKCEPVCANCHIRRTYERGGWVY